MSTICLECAVATAVGPMAGHMGLPSLDSTPRARGRHPLSRTLSPGLGGDTDETFGYLYSGLEAIGVFTHAIETYRSFLVEHSGKGHRLYWWVEEHEDLPGDYEGMEYRYLSYPEPRRPPKGYVKARLRFSCERCDEQYQSRAAEWVRSFEARTLTKESLRLFRQRTVDPSEHNIHEAWPFDITLFDDLDDWLRAHARHTLTIELVREETGRRGAVRRRRKADAAAPTIRAPEPWTPTPLDPEDDERRLGPISEEALPLLAGLYHREPSVRSRALKDLGHRGEAGTLGHLVPLLDDPTESVRAAAVRAIGVVPDRRIARCLGYALLDESASVRRAARRALADRGLDRREALEKARSPRRRLDGEEERAGTLADAPDRLTRILRDAVHPEHSTRSDAAKKLRSKADARVLEMILAMLSDYSHHTATHAAESAGALRAREAIEGLLSMAEEARRTGSMRDSHTLLDVIEALGRIGDPRGLPGILRGLDHGESNVRDRAVEALAGLKGAAGTAALMDALEAPKDDVRRYAIHHLGQRKAREALPALVAALRDEEYLVRTAAAAALVHMGDPSGLDAVLETVVEGDAYVAFRAHEHLIGQGDPRTEDTLVEALHYNYGWSDVKSAASRYVLSGNERLAAAGRRLLPGGRPRRGVEAVPWGSKRRR